VGRLRRRRNQLQETAAPMQSLRLSDAANDNDNDDDNCDFIVVDLCVVYSSFAAKISNITALFFWVRVGIGYGLALGTS